MKVRFGRTAAIAAAVSLAGGALTLPAGAAAAPVPEANCVGVLSEFVAQSGTRDQFAPLPGDAVVSVVAREHGDFTHCLSVYNATVTP
jgi:hypothetical protein